jgi:hypothetical protein
MFPNEIVDCLHLVGNRTNNPYGFRLRLFCVWLLWPSCVFGVKKVIKKQPLARSGIVATGSLGVRFESVVFTFIIEKCSF